MKWPARAAGGRSAVPVAASFVRCVLGASGFDRDRSKRISSHTVGFSFKPIPNVVIKADYRNRDAQEGQIADEFNLGIGYVF